MDWDTLKTQCGACRKCGLSEIRRHVVFGVGDETSPLMLVGEGPGQVEDETGEPFTGPAGKLLDDMLLIIGLDRSKVYIANIVKCRPPGNRDPLPAEQESCMPWLEEQIRLINPKMIVCLGRIAAARLIRDTYKITKEHGEIVEKDGRLMAAIYHPAALLRDPSKRPDTFDDLKKIEKVLLSVAPGWMEQATNC